MGVYLRLAVSSSVTEEEWESTHKDLQNIQKIRGTYVRITVVY